MGIRVRPEPEDTTDKRRRCCNGCRWRHPYRKICCHLEAGERELKLKQGQRRPEWCPREDWNE